MPRNILFSLLLLLGLSVVAGFYIRSVAREVSEIGGNQVEPAFERPAAPLYEPTDPPLRVKLFFPATSNDVLLRTRDLTIFASADVENRVRQVVEHLIRGGDDPAIFGSLPEGVRLNQVFVSDDGIAYLDFNIALSENHPGGVLPEQATLYSIVNSLAYNFDEVNRVKILIGGNEQETLAGHLLLLLPLEVDMSISDIAGDAELISASRRERPE